MVHHVVCLLMILYGMGSWIAINGIWAELPILVSVLPEKWNLPTYLVLIIQIANIGPLIFTVLRHVKPGFTSLKYGSYTIIAIGFIACALFAPLWDKIISSVSIPFFLLSFMLALVDCTSSVVFLPYMAKYPAGYMIAFYIGEGMSGVAPSLMGLVQGAGGDTCSNDPHHPQTQPRFSVSIYFVILSALMVITGLAFFLLNNLVLCTNERESLPSSVTPDRGSPSDKSSDDVLLSEIKVRDIFCISIETPRKQEALYVNIRSLFLQLYIITAVVCALGNGVIPAILAYACLPYGPTTYHLATELSLLANPIVCFAAFYLTCKSSRVLSVMCVGAVGVAGVIIYTATLSPTPWLIGTSTGSVLIVFICVLWTAVISYIKVCVASILRDYGENALLWCGVVTQVGSFIGAIVIFIVTLKTNTFTQC